jgi:hypothetical protein
VARNDAACDRDRDRHGQESNAIDLSVGISTHAQQTTVSVE